MTMMFVSFSSTVVLTLLLFASTKTAIAWTQTPTDVNGKSVLRLQAAKEGFMDSSRRSLLIATVATITLSGASGQQLPAWAEEKPTGKEVDPLEAFGKQLSSGDISSSNQGWPHSPSPLPTLVRSARELTAPSPGEDAGVASLTMSDLDKALQESAQKKQVGPRTHG